MRSAALCADIGTRPRLGSLRAAPCSSGLPVGTARDLARDRVVLLGLAERHDFDHLSGLQPAERRLGRVEIDEQPRALVNLGDQRGRRDPVARIKIGKADMSGKGRADSAFGERQRGLITLDLRCGKRGFARFNLAVGQRAGILDPAIARQKLPRLIDPDLGQLQRQPFGPRIEFDQNRVFLHEGPGTKADRRNPARNLWEYLGGTRGSCRSYRLDNILVSKQPRGLGDNRNPAITAAIFIGRAGGQQHQGRHRKKKSHRLWGFSNLRRFVQSILLRALGSEGGKEKGAGTDALALRLSFAAFRRSKQSRFMALFRALAKSTTNVAAPPLMAWTSAAARDRRRRCKTRRPHAAARGSHRVRKIRGGPVSCSTPGLVG